MRGVWDQNHPKRDPREAQRCEGAIALPRIFLLFPLKSRYESAVVLNWEQLLLAAYFFPLRSSQARHWSGTESDFSISLSREAIRESRSKSQYLLTNPILPTVQIHRV